MESNVRHPEIEDGYPTESTLETIKHWTLEDGIGPLLDYIAEAFTLQIGSATNVLSPAESSLILERTGERYLRLATGGWSGCEEVIEAFCRNDQFLYGLCWRLSASGGLHIYQYPPSEEGA